MSSLAAARADNFYYPKDFDPQKHGSLNKYHGSHPLRERASRISEGILVIRFEVPFHIWCSKCGEKIAKGRRFNADKKAIGQYHSTKIWQFSMRHHCGCIITIQTDPKNAEYVVVEGAKKKAEEYTAEDAGVPELLDDAEKERLALDPLYRLERGEVSKKRARTAAEDVAALLERADAKHADAYATNAKLRAKLRVVRKQEQALDAEREALHLPEEIRLLPQAQEDTQAAALAFYAHDAAGGTATQQQAARRQAILSEPIFSPARPAPGRPPGGAHAQAGTHRPTPAGALDAGGPIPPDQSVSSRELHGRSDPRPRVCDVVAHAHAGKGGQLGDRTVRSSAVARQHRPALALVISTEQGQQGFGVGRADSGSPAVAAGAALSGTPRRTGLQLGSGGAAAGAAPSTAAAARKRSAGLQAAHQSAQAAVAAWQAGRGAASGQAIVGATTVPAVTVRPGGQPQRQETSGTRTYAHRPKSASAARHGQRGAAAAATLAKAKQLALERRAGGVGFVVPRTN